MSEEPNNYEQKKRFHAMVRDISRQVEWAGEMMDEDEWKLLILAGSHGQGVVPNPLYDSSDHMSPPFLIRNKKRTRDLAKSGDKSMADLITQLFAFGAEKGVEWSDPEKAVEWAAMMNEARGRN
jgi:hypothetical protein